MPDRMRFALHVPNFGEANQLVSLGVKAEATGWDGFFVGIICLAALDFRFR